MQQAVALSASAASLHQGRPPNATRRRRLGDPIFAIVATTAGIFVLVLMGSLILSLFVGGLPAFARFGAGFLTSTDLGSGA